MNTCPICKKEFVDVKKLNCHINWHKGFEKYNKQKNLENKVLDESTKCERKFICEKCHQEFVKNLTNKEYTNYIKYHSKIFCSRSCANSRILSQEQKEKISKSLIKKNHLKNYTRERNFKICKVCRAEYILAKGISTPMFCSMKCYGYYKSHKRDFLSEETLLKYRECGKRVAQYFKENRRSKNEIAFCELCKTKFEKVLNNEPMFNGWDADIILPDLKIAILWNGRWHYEKITSKHSVEQVQNRDKIKINEIIKSGYYPYIIKDLGKYSKKKVNEEFGKFNIFLENKGLQ